MRFPHIARSWDPGQLRRPDKCFSDFSRDQSNESIAVSRPGPPLLAAQMPPPVLPGQCCRPLRRSLSGRNQRYENLDRRPALFQHTKHSSNILVACIFFCTTAADAVAAEGLEYVPADRPGRPHSAKGSTTTSEYYQGQLCHRQPDCCSQSATSH